MPPLHKQEFFGLENTTWLYTGAESPVHKSVRAAVDAYMDERTLGPRGRAFNARQEEECREKLARLLSVTAVQIALLSNASEAISSVLLSLRLQPGDNIVLNTLEYPSAMLAGLSLGEQDVEVRIAPHNNWMLEAEDLLRLVDDKTRLVATSHVSYLSGTRLNYKKLYETLRTTPTLLLLDATQSLGVLPVDANFADFTVSSTYKWLLGMHGAGVLAVNPQRTRHLNPPSAGWRSVPDLFSPQRFEKVERYGDARRFELGFPSFATIAALNASVEIILETGIQNIAEYSQSLGTDLLCRLEESGWEVMTPRDEKKRGASISFVCPQGEKLAAALAEKSILCWGGDGRARFSIHGFNDEDDINRAVSTLAEIASQYQ